MTTLSPRLFGRVHAWFDSKDARVGHDAAPRGFSTRARLALTNLEDRVVPASVIVTNDGDSGNGSLRAAIDIVNASFDPANDISFNAGFFSSAKTITLGTPLPSIGVPVDIIGLQSGGTNIVTVSGGGLVHIFDTTAAPAGTPITFEKLNITKGVAPSNTLDFGGGITMGDENVTVSNTTISGCTARVGGAINISDVGTLNLRNSTLSGNLANSTVSFEGGGAIYSLTAATLDFQNSTLSGNNSRLGGALLIYGLYGSGSLNVLNCTVSGNVSSVSRGGGFYIFGQMSLLDIRNSTFTGNVAATSGGALAFQSVGGVYPNPTLDINVTNCTITGNTANSGSSTIGNGGGGILANGSSSGPNNLNLVSTIVSGNVQPTGGQFNDLSIVANTTLNMTFTAIGTNKGFTHAPPDGINKNLAYGTDLKLDTTLKSNGAAAGAPQTIALLVGSPAIDVGSNPALLTTDNRGTGFAREVPTGFPDIGAYERIPGQPVATPGSVPDVTTDSPATNPYKFSIVYADDTAINVSTLGTGDIVVTGPNSFNQTATFVGVDINTNGSPRIATYQITPPGGSWDFHDNGNYTVTLQANEVKSTSNIAVLPGTIATFNVGVLGTVLVTNANDSGTGSLRDAITRTNAGLNSIDTILFDPTFFNTSMKTITLASALPGITDGVIITGPGANFATVSGAGAFRIFDTTPAPAGSSITITGLTLANGSTTGNGGGINTFDEALTLTNLVIQNNTANEGGAISLGAAAATLVLTNSTLANNTVTEDGGAINVGSAANLTITNSTLSGNSAGSDGGGIYFLSGGSLNMTRSTVSGNTASGGVGGFNNGGGGIYFFGTIAAAGFKISNSTISGNTHTALSGGGLAFVATVGTPVITNSTITANVATTGVGGGISRITGTNLITITSSILAENIDVGALPDINWGFSEADASFSAVGTDPNGSLNDYSGVGKNNIPLGTPLVLGPLAFNLGGTTQTHLPGGVLLDAGANPTPLSPDVDQNGNSRSFNQTDIGSVEVQPAAAVSGFVVNDNAVQRSRLTQVVVNFTSMVDASLFQSVGAVTFTRTDVTGGPVVNTSNGLVIAPATGLVSSLTLTFQNITNAGVEFGSLSDGRWQLAIPLLSFTSPLNGTDLRRLFGDINGDGTVDGPNDFAAFGAVFGTTAPGNPFDFNNDGTIDGSTDFAQFGSRFGVTL